MSFATHITTKNFYANNKQRAILVKKRDRIWNNSVLFASKQYCKYAWQYASVEVQSMKWLHLYDN